MPIFIDILKFSLRELNVIHLDDKSNLSFRIGFRIGMYE